MVHARVVRQSRRGGTVARINQAAIRRAGKGEIEIIRHGNFVTVLGADETAVAAAAAAAVASRHVAWTGSIRSTVAGGGTLVAAAADGRSIARGAASG
jgi:nicotinate dehydrogenase subunit B